jgi:ankyrin repeat protein
MLIESGANVNARNKNNDGPLHLAADRGHLDIAVKLIEKGAVVNAVDKNSNVPLMLSIRKDHTDLAAALISSGAYKIYLSLLSPLFVSFLKS